LKVADHEHTEQLLVAASPNDEVADTHWYRPQFDHFLIREAQDAGVCYLDQTVLAPPAFEGNEVSLHGQRLGRTVALRARFLVDGSGPRGYLFRSLKIPELPFESLPATQGLFSHFSGVRRIEHCGVLPRHEQPPYPVDDAALHHVFDGGWIWVLHFNNGLTSAGVAARDDLAAQLALPSGQAAWQKLLDRIPTVRDQFTDAKVELPFMHTPRLSFRSSRVVGPNWAMLPSAAGFIDPLLSTGFTLTLLGVVRLAQAIAQDWERPSFVQRLEAYSGQTGDELLATERLVGALYSSMGDFPVFRALCLLYFAAVSYIEIGRRFKRPGLSSFLLHDHAEFGPRAQACCQQALAQVSNGSLTPAARTDLVRRVLEAIAPIDLIGLTDSRRRHWYPVRAEEIQWARQKLGIPN
jgi:FADH2 O2-dependent halogenase